MKKKVIKDPMGQWKHPGEITEIPSGNITMMGVNYPVMGVDNMGNSMMMMPGQHYKFPGDTVTEFPMMQYGGATPTYAINLPTSQIYGAQPKPQAVPQRTFAGAISGALPVYGQINDASNMVQGAKTGNSYDFLTGLYGFTPMKSIDVAANVLDYATEKTAGKQAADDLQAKREGIINMSSADRIKLFERYGHGGYDKWKAEGFPKLGAGGEIDPDKAREILEDGSVYNRPLTDKQIDYFSRVAGVTLDEDGDVVDDESSEDSEEYRYGGTYMSKLRKPKRKSGRNLKSSINFLMARNEMLFGHGDNRIYDPNMKDGGDCGCKKMSQGGNCDDFIPGQTDDNFLKNRKMEFLQFLTKNNMEAMANQEADRIDTIVKKYGGEKEFIKGFYELPVYLFQYGGENQPEYLPMKPAYLPTTNIEDEELMPPTNFGQPQPQANTVSGATYFPMNFRNGKPDTESSINWALAGANAITSIANSVQDRKAMQRMKSMQNADNLFYSTPAGDRGDYDINSGMFRPNDMVPVQFAGQNFGSRGSKYTYQEGGEYELSDDEIAEILRNGGEIEYID